MMDKLTPEQEAMLPEIREEWYKHGMSTERANWDAAREGVAEAYQQAGFTPPELYLQFASPLEGAIASWMINRLEAWLPEQAVTAKDWKRALDEVRTQKR